MPTLALEEAPAPPENPHAHEEITLNPAHAPSPQIEAAAEAVGRSDLVGLYIADEKKKYVVLDAGVKRHMDRSVTSKVGLPGFRGGLDALDRTDHTSTTHKVGLPHLFRRTGKVWTPGRNEDINEGNVSYEEGMVVGVYDAGGDLKKIQKLTQDEFFAICDEQMGRYRSETPTGEPEHRDEVVAGWMKPEPVTDRDFNIELLESPTGDNFEAFDDIEEELRFRGLASQKGISFEQNGVIKEVVFDGDVKRRAVPGGTDEWQRTFVIKTTRDGALDNYSIRSAYMWARDLQEAADANHQRGINNDVLTSVRMQRERPGSHLADEHYRYFGWLATPRDHEEAVASAAHEAEIEAYIDSRLSDDSPEEVFFDGDKKVPAWLLSYADILDDDHDARLDNVNKLHDTIEGRRRIRNIKEAIVDKGLVVVYDTAYKLREDFLETMRRLDHPVIAGLDHSLSPVVGALADKWTPGSDLFDDADVAQVKQSRIVDELVGRAVARAVPEDAAVAGASPDRAMIQLRRRTKPSGRLNAMHQPALAMFMEVAPFNEDFFVGKDGPAILSDQLKRRSHQEQLRNPLIKAGKAIYEKIKRDEAIDPVEYEEFGHMLRSSVNRTLE